MDESAAVWEVVFMLWLVIMGAKPKPLADPAFNSATAA
jgi:hypothetical protein